MVSSGSVSSPEGLLFTVVASREQMVTGVGDALTSPDQDSLLWRVGLTVTSRALE